jgi:flagellar motor switch protein FliN
VVAKADGNMADDSPEEILNPADIEALLKSAGNPPGGSSSGASPGGDDAPGKQFSPSDIEALLNQSSGGTAGADSPERLIQQAQDNLAAAVATDLPPLAGPTGQPKPFAFSPFDSAKGATAAGSGPLDALNDVELDLRIELGRTELLIEEVLRLKPGAVVPLDKLAGDPVDILVNGRIIARGEVLVLNDNFCVRVAEILAPDG